MSKPQFLWFPFLHKEDRATIAPLKFIKLDVTDEEREVVKRGRVKMHELRNCKQNLEMFYCGYFDVLEARNDAGFGRESNRTSWWRQRVAISRGGNFVLMLGFPVYYTSVAGNIIPSRTVSTMEQIGRCKAQLV